MKDSVQAKHLSHSYEYPYSSSLSLDDITLNIRDGEFFTILGHNGCGKTTLAKHFNALVELQQGELAVAGISAVDKNSVRQIRRSCGMVFQNPDNQFVSSVVEEDIAFGLENFDFPEETIPKKTADALAYVGMSGYEKRSPHMLSGGEKQRAAIAGVLAVEPDILVFDEATSMLDPRGREEVLSIIKKLNTEEHKTIVMITNNVEEAVLSDTVCLMKHGRIIASGPPCEILTDPELLSRAYLEPPMAVRVFLDLKNSGVTLRNCPLTTEELVKEICSLR